MATQCKECGTLYFPPRADCPKCRGSEVAWVPIEGKGKLVTFNEVYVYRDPADLEPRRDVVSQFQVVRPDPPIQTVVRLVRHGHNFVSILELRHTQHGTKDLVTTNLHLARDVSEDRRFEKASFVEPWIARPLASIQ